MPELQQHATAENNMKPCITCGTGIIKGVNGYGLSDVCTTCSGGWPKYYAKPTQSINSTDYEGAILEMDESD